MNRVGAALIGCGKVGHTHAQALASLAESRFLAAYDPNAANAEAFAARYGVKPYSDLDALLAHPGLDMVTICTPHPSHPDLAVACTQAGIHILVEKPLAVDLRGCDRMIDAADAAGVKLGVISQRRFYEPVLRVRQAILLSNSQKPGFYGKIHVHGATGASVGVQTDGGSPFISGITTAIEPPINDIWTVPGEEGLLAGWQAEDTARCQAIDVMTHYHRLQIQDFLQAIIGAREPAVTGREGRKPVEIFTAVYRSQRDRRPVKFPPDAEMGAEQFDGRLTN